MSKLFLIDGTIELLLSDANLPPGVTNSQRLNSTVVWERFNGGEWMRTDERSLFQAAEYYLQYDSIVAARVHKLSDAA